MVHYVIPMTGSCGNCYIFYDGATSVVIDCGITLKKLKETMEAHAIPFSSLSAMFLTHIHPDHAKGVGVFQRKTGLPVFVSDTCYFEGKMEMLRLKMERDRVFHRPYGDTVQVGDFSVTSFQTFHDSPGSSGYFLENGESRFFVMTDTGKVPEEAYSYAPLANVKFIEANYDEEMLENGPYPKWLKDRVRGTYGHLGNLESMEFAKRVSRHQDQLYFIHVSDNNNDITLLRKLVSSTIPSGIFCKVAERGEMFEGFSD